jgi:hypothetical protein
MPDAPLSTRTSPALADTAQAVGRIAVLLLFTGLFAAAWNGDQSSSVVPQIAGRPQDRRARIEIGAEARGAVSATSASGTRAGAAEFFPQRSTRVRVGGMLAQSARPEPSWTPFTGSPALLGGTLRLSDDETPIIVTVQPDAEEAAR